MSDTPHQDALAAGDDPLAEITKRIDAAGATITEMRAILDEPSGAWETMTNDDNVPERLQGMENNRWNWFTDYLNNMFSTMGMGIDSAQLMYEDDKAAMHANAKEGLAKARDDYEHRNGEFAMLKKYLLEQPPETLGLTTQLRDTALASLAKLEDQKNDVIKGVDAYVETGTVPPIQGVGEGR